MKCLSKTIIKYKREQQEAERQIKLEEKLSKMTPEERQAYTDEQRKKAIEALAFFNFAKTGFNRGHYF